MRLLPSRGAKTETRQSRQPAKGRGVFSYYASRAPENANTERGAKARAAAKKLRWHYLPSFFAAIALIISLGYILTLSPDPKISIAGGTNGLSLRTPDSYRQVARGFLGRSWLNRNKLTIDTGQVERQLKQQFPELNDVAITLPLLGHRPVVELVAVQPALVLVSKDQLVVVASNGRAVATGKNLNNEALKALPRVDDNSGLSLQAGVAVLPAAQVSFIQSLIAQLKIQKLALQSLNLPTAPNEVDVHLAGLPYFLKFNTELDERQQVGVFLATKQKLDSEHITPGEYMDLRVEEKVFYK